MAEIWKAGWNSYQLVFSFVTTGKNRGDLKGLPRKKRTQQFPEGHNPPPSAVPSPETRGWCGLHQDRCSTRTLPLRFITHKYRLVSSLQEVLGLWGDSQLHLQRACRRGSLRSSPALHHFLLPDGPEAAFSVGGGTALKAERLGLGPRTSCRPLQGAWLDTPMATRSQDSLTPTISFPISCGRTVQGPRQ